MGRKKATGVSRLQVLEAICDDISITMFNTIANNPESPDSLADNLNISRKQCYDRISKLHNAGLLERKNKKYFVTSFGKLIYQAQLKVAKAASNYWKLKVIDAIKSYNEIPNTEYEDVIHELIDDPEIKKLILGLHNTPK